MRSLLLLAMGAVAGAVATVMFFSVDPAFEGQGDDGPGGGNARLSLDAEALATIVEARLEEVQPSGADTAVGVKINPNGLIDVTVTVGAPPVGVPVEFVLDPEVVEGGLEIVVVDARVGPLVAPEQLRDVVEKQLQDQLAALAGGFEYRLTAITTTDDRLTLEIEI